MITNFYVLPFCPMLKIDLVIIPQINIYPYKLVQNSVNKKWQMFIIQFPGIEYLLALFNDWHMVMCTNK